MERCSRVDRKLTVQETNFQRPSDPTPLQTSQNRLSQKIRGLVHEGNSYLSIGPTWPRVASCSFEGTFTQQIPSVLLTLILCRYLNS